MRRLIRRILLYALQIVLILPLLYVYSGIRYRRRHRVPKGPCLIVSNHNSHLDAAVLMHAFPFRRIADVHPVAAADYFGKSPVLSLLAHGLMNAIPIDRKPKPGEDPLRRIKVALKRGKSLIFFPEGSRGEAGVVAPFRTGVGRLVQEVPGLLVVPVFISGVERIWPRGKAVPVPLGIDVNIGRPRTYDSGRSAREIAEAIRDDVLSLAPPPPPVPGPRPAAPKRIAVCGIDAEAVAAHREALTAAFGRTHPTLGIGRPTWVAESGTVREAASPIPTVRSRFWLRVVGACFKRAPESRETFTETVERGAIDEALQHGRDARVVVGGGGALIDVLARAHAEAEDGRLDDEAYLRLLRWLTGERTVTLREAWSAWRSAPVVATINFFDLVRLPPPDGVVFLRASPEARMRALRSAGLELDARENEEHLAKLQQGYRRALELLEKRYRTETIVSEGESPESLAARAAAHWAPVEPREEGTAGAR